MASLGLDNRQTGTGNLRGTLSEAGSEAKLVRHAALVREGFPFWVRDTRFKDQGHDFGGQASDDPTMCMVNLRLCRTELQAKIV